MGYRERSTETNRPMQPSILVRCCIQHPNCTDLCTIVRDAAVCLPDRHNALPVRVRGGSIGEKKNSRGAAAATARWTSFLLWWRVVTGDNIIGNYVIPMRFFCPGEDNFFGTGRWCLRRAVRQLLHSTGKLGK